MVDASHATRRKYKRDLDLLEPDLEAYKRQKALATGGILNSFDASGSTNSSLVPVRIYIYINRKTYRTTTDKKKIIF